MGPAPVDPLFNDTEADVIVASADGTQFRLRRKFLETNTGAFPGSEFDTRGEVVHLTEVASVLRILFGFVIPRKHPDIEHLPFALLAEVAEAAEKYEVFSAVNVCKMQMKQFVPTHPLEILLHGAKHDHPGLIKRVAPHVVRLPIMQVVQQLPPRYLVPWLEYRTSWDSIFEKATKSVLDAGVSNRNKHGTYFSASLTAELCYSCKVAMLRAIQEFKEIINVVELKEALAKPRPRLMTCLSSGCAYMTMSSRVCEDMREQMNALDVFTVPSLT